MPPAIQEMSAERVTEAVRSHVSGASSRMRVTRCRTGKFNTSFFVEGDGTADLVIRIAPPPGTGVLFYERNMMAQEPGLHRLLRERTRVPVAEIVAYDTSRKILQSDFILMERLPGVSLTEAEFMGAADVEKVCRQVGEYLSKVHALHADAYGYLGEHRPMAPQSTWREAFRVMWDKIVDDTLGCGGYSREEADRMRQLLDRFETLFDRDIPASLLHMDIWHQNILVDRQGTVTGIVDWDRALWGDPEIEFAVLDYCGVSTPAFWEGYGRPRDESPEARIRNHFYLLYEVQKYILISLLRRRSRAQAEQYRQYVFGLADELPS